MTTEPPQRLGVPLGRYANAMAELAHDGFHCVDLTAVDHLGTATGEGGRFELVLQVFRGSDRRQVSVRLDADTAPSVASSFPSVAMMEREVHDLFGITFSMQVPRLFLGEEAGAPLRKDAARTGEAHG